MSAGIAIKVLAMYQIALFTNEFTMEKSHINVSNVIEHLEALLILKIMKKSILAKNHINVHIVSNSSELFQILKTISQD